MRLLCELKGGLLVAERVGAWAATFETKQQQRVESLTCMSSNVALTSPSFRRRYRGPASRSPTDPGERRRGGLVWRGRPHQTQQRKGREERGALHLRATGTAQQRQRLSPPRACTDGFPQVLFGEMPPSTLPTRMTSYSERCAAFSTSSRRKSSTSSERSCCSWASTRRTFSRA